MMNAQAVVAAAQAIVMRDPERPLFSMLESFGRGDATRVYVDGMWWDLVVSEHPPGTFAFSWEPDSHRDDAP